MSTRQTFFATILMFASFVGHAAGQTAPRRAPSGAQPPTKTVEMPKIMKFEGKGIRAAETAVKFPRPKAMPPPSAPPPLSPVVMATVFKSLGIGGTPQPGEYALLTAQHPFAEGRAGMVSDGPIRSDAQQNFVRCSNESFAAQDQGCGMAFDIKPAAAGQYYLVDIAVQTIFPTTTFYVGGPDGSNTTEILSKGSHHILATFSATNTKWQGFGFYTSDPTDWTFLYCKVTLLK